MLCADKTVVGYDTLAVGAIALVAVTGHVRRNMPDLLPVMVLGQLAVDTEHQRRSIGTGLLRDAILRAIQVCGDRRYPSDSGPCPIIRLCEALL